MAIITVSGELIKSELWAEITPFFTSLVDITTCGDPDKRFIVTGEGLPNENISVSLAFIRNENGDLEMYCRPCQ